MPDVQLRDGSKFLRNSSGQAIVWLPRNVDITIDAVACNNSASQFLYIDPWGKGSQLRYEGGIPGAVSGKCDWIGMFTAAYDAARSVGRATSEPNLLRQDAVSEGTFNTGAGNFLEVVSGPLRIASSVP